MGQKTLAETIKEISRKHLEEEKRNFTWRMYLRGGMGE